MLRREFRVDSVLAVRGPRRASAAWCFDCPWSIAARTWRSVKAIACEHAANCPKRGGRR